MTVSELFEYVDAILENAFPDKIKLRWLNQVEAEIQIDVLLMAPEGIVQYTEEDLNAELIVPTYYDQLYHEYLFWQICLAQQEDERANKYAVTFNRVYNEYVRFVCETINPGNGLAEKVRYYLTAYQIAVKHGETGTELEWLESLKGEKGDRGDGIHLLGVKGTENELPETSENGDAYLVGTAENNRLYVYDNGWNDMGPLRGKDGTPGKDGNDGAPGQPGTSITVSSVQESTDSGGTNVVTFSDGNTLNVKNGKDGEQGEPGADGVSPVVEVEEITGGHRVRVTDVNGVKTFDVMDGADGQDGETADGGGYVVFNVEPSEDGENVQLKDCTFQDIYDAVSSGKNVCLMYLDTLYYLSFVNPSVLTFSGASASERLSRLDVTYFTITPNNAVSLEIVAASSDTDTIQSPETAKVGQTIRVTEVDETGKPTAWEAVNFTSGDTVPIVDELPDVAGDEQVVYLKNDPLDEEPEETEVVTSINGKTGAVTLNAASVGAYSKDEIEAIMGSYITDIDTLVGGES